MEFAKNEFWLDSIVQGSKSGLTQRKNLEQVKLAIGKAPPELERSSRLPTCFLHVWEWYNRDLKWSSPLTYMELQAWSQTTRRPVTAFEVDLLMTLDKHYRNQP